jgi:cysteine synthase
MSRVKKKDAFATGREIAKTESLLVGIYTMDMGKEHHI